LAVPLAAAETVLWQLECDFDSCLWLKHQHVWYSTDSAFSAVLALLLAWAVPEERVASPAAEEASVEAAVDEAVVLVAVLEPI